MVYGERLLSSGHSGPDVEELQIRLAGFRGTLFDGEFGPGTELQVVEFQKRFMQLDAPSGEVDKDTFLAIGDFAARYPLDFQKLKCPCGQCPGFGQRQFEGEYFEGQPKTERFHRYEYPGIHRAILWAVRAAFFLMPEREFEILCGYRCSIHNAQKERTTTNHHGKAVDFQVSRRDGHDDRAAMKYSDEVRGKLVELSNAQIGWGARNRKALEPADIAPTWVHYDVREYESKYLDEKFFVTSLDALNNDLPITI